MIWILGIIVLAGLSILAMQLGVVPPLDAAILIRIRDGVPYASKGQLRAHAREHLAEIFHDAGVERGFIAIKTNNRITFSWKIPRAIHQRLRNVLLNQWD